MLFSSTNSAAALVSAEPFQTDSPRELKPQRETYGILPSSSQAPRRIEANDYFSNAAARMGYGTQSLPEGTSYTLDRLSYNYWLLITLYRNHWISRKIVDGPANDMVRAWPRLTSEIDPKQLSKIDRSIRRTNTRQNLAKAIRWARLFGGAGALIVIEGHEKQLDQPLDPDTIDLGSYRGLIPFDRWVGITTVGDVSTDITKPMEFNLPTYYQVQTPGSGGSSFRVHPSRVLRFLGPEVPTPEYEAQNWWGISCLEPVFEEIKKRDNMSWNILMLTFRANLLAFKDDELAQALSGVNMSGRALIRFQERMQAMNQLLSNNNMLVVPKDGGLESTQYGFSGLSDVYQQFQLDISGASEYPVSRLFGRTISGLGQSNDADERMYEERIAMEQELYMRPQLDILYPIIAMSELGEIPNDLDLKFPSIRVMDDKEQADLAKTIGDNIASMFDRQIFTRSMALKELKQSSDVTGFGTNVTDEMIADAEEEETRAKELEQMAGLLGDPEVDEKSAEGSESETLEQRQAGSGGGKQMMPPRAPKGTEVPGRAKDAEVVSRFDFAGIPIAIEYPAGARRLLKNPEGDVVYDRVMDFDYGFIRNTVSEFDGDEIDVILGKDERAKQVYIAWMIDLGPDEDRREDEDKVLIGFPDIDSAREAFCSMYPRDWLGRIRVADIDKFRERVAATGHAPNPVMADSALDDFEESKHPRGGQKNKGQFVRKGGGSAGSARLMGSQSSAGLQVRSSPKPTGVKLAAVKQRTFNGESVQTRKVLSKLETGDIGERIVTQWLRDQGMKDARTLNIKGNNAPIDLIQDHGAIEVKCGQVSNSAGAQQWRATIGQPGKEESAALKKMSPEKKREYNAHKADMIFRRKEQLINNLSKEIGHKVKGRTMTVLINPDTRTADLFSFEGFHKRIGWNSDLMQKGYVGSFRYQH